jgi:hypothetical protein
MSSGYAKVSITLPEPLLAEVKARVGARGLSAFVAQVLEAEVRREGLREFLAQQEARFGPIPEDVLEETLRSWFGHEDN